MDPGGGLNPSGGMGDCIRALKQTVAGDDGALCAWENHFGLDCLKIRRDFLRVLLGKGFLFRSFTSFLNLRCRGGRRERVR